jgi:ATP-dependent RNA helicase RhlE
VKKSDKSALISDILYKEAVTSALVFVRTKHGANDLTKLLNASGVLSDTIHGNKTQGQRQRTLKSFKQGKVKVLVATDIASRGIDIDDLTHVINYDMPESAETYLHRIGRTARAGKEGNSISFCSPQETHLLKSIQKHIEMKIPVEGDHRFKIEKADKKKNKSNKRVANGSTKPPHKKGKGKGKKSESFDKFSKSSTKSYKDNAKKYKVKRRSYQGK